MKTRVTRTILFQSRRMYSGVWCQTVVRSETLLEFFFKADISSNESTNLSLFYIFLMTFSYKVFVSLYLYTVGVKSVRTVTKSRLKCWTIIFIKQYFLNKHGTSILKNQHQKNKQHQINRRKYSYCLYKYQEKWTKWQKWTRNKILLCKHNAISFKYRLLIAIGLRTLSGIAATTYRTVFIIIAATRKSKEKTAEEQKIIINLHNHKCKNLSDFIISRVVKGPRSTI